MFFFFLLPPTGHKIRICLCSPTASHNDASDWLLTNWCTGCVPPWCHEIDGSCLSDLSSRLQSYRGGNFYFRHNDNWVRHKISWTTHTVTSRLWASHTDSATTECDSDARGVRTGWSQTVVCDSYFEKLTQLPGFYIYLSLNFNLKLIWFGPIFDSDVKSSLFLLLLFLLLGAITVETQQNQGSQWVLFSRSSKRVLSPAGTGNNFLHSCF